MCPGETYNLIYSPQSNLIFFFSLYIIPCNNIQLKVLFMGIFFEELLMSQVVQQKALTRLLVVKGVFTKEELLEMVRVVDQEIKKKDEGRIIK